MNLRQRIVVFSGLGPLVGLGLGVGLGLAACGDSGGGADAATTADATGDTGGDTASDVALPSDCWLPAAPTATMDCALMCEKVGACGASEPDCLSECAALEYMLSPEAGVRVEECFVDLPCTGGPAVFGAAGCVARLADDATFTPASSVTTGCAALTAKAESCGLDVEVKEAIAFQCDKYAIGLDAAVMERAAACATEACDAVATCLEGSSCAWDGIPTGSGQGFDDKDACLDEGDRSEIATGGVYAEALTCGDTCAGQASACAGNCVVEATDLSAACSRCFGALGACVHASCDADCADPAAAGCYACQVGAGCAAAFATCSGGPVPGSPEDLACTAKDREDIAASGDITASVTKCVAQCQDGASCAENCMWTVLDIADEGRCTACGGDLAVCAATECGAACDDATKLGECYGCLDRTTCLDAFAACSGVAVPTPAGAACVAVADADRAADGSAWHLAAGCLRTCGGDAGCVATCVRDALGLASACQPCYAALASCAATTCAEPCGRAAEGIECATCLADEGCVATFEACGGLAPYPAPTAGTATCDAALDCALGCGTTASCVEECVVGAEPALIGLARRTAACVRETCKGKDVSCVATSCLADYQQCTGTAAELSCTGIDACLAGCGDSAECQLGCFTRASDAAAVGDFLAIGQCIERFCGPVPDAGCRARALAEPALCVDAVAVCVDPSATPAAPECSDIVTCVNLCPDDACRATCATGAAVDAQGEVSALFGCIADACPGGEPLCVYDKCFAPFQACFGVPETGLSCSQIFQCQASDGCESYSCQETCVGSAADGAQAVAFQGLLDCFISKCLGPNGWIPGCTDTAAGPGGDCEAAANACP